MTMPNLTIFKGGEVLVEDRDPDGDIFESFYHLDARDVYVENDNGQRLFELNDENVPEAGPLVRIEVPKDQLAHEIVWRFSLFDIDLIDPNHELKPSDFYWHRVIIGDYEFKKLCLDEKVGELEFSFSSDGICDEDLEVYDGEEEETEDPVAS